MRYYWIAATAVLAVVSCGAAVAQATPWHQEPKAFLGIRLGDPLSASGVAACPFVGRVNERGRPEPMLVPPGHPICARQADLTVDVVFLSGLPDLGVDYSATVFNRNGQVSTIQLTFADRDVEAMLELLNEKFGKHTSADTFGVANLAGAKFTAQSFTWLGQTVRISLVSRASRIDEAVIQATHLPLEAEASREKKARASSGASKL